VVAKPAGRSKNKDGVSAKIQEMRTGLTNSKELLDLILNPF
jgi:hypothetical protein